MSSHDENDTNSIITGVTMRNISKHQHQTVVSFRLRSECNTDEFEEKYKTIVGNVLSGRDVIVVTKKDQLTDLISDAVETTDRNYISENALKVASFTPNPESSVRHHATLVKRIPLSVAEDLAISTEFTYGNLWFLIPPNNADINQYVEDVVNDIRKLTALMVQELPLLRHETVASPYDLAEIWWFRPNEDVYQKPINPPLESQFLLKV